MHLHDEVWTSSKEEKWYNLSGELWNSLLEQCLIQQKMSILHGQVFLGSKGNGYTWGIQFSANFSGRLIAMSKISASFCFLRGEINIPATYFKTIYILCVVFSADMLLLASINTPWRVSVVVGSIFLITQK